MTKYTIFTLILLFTLSAFGMEPLAIQPGYTSEKENFFLELDPLVDGSLDLPEPTPQSLREPAALSTSLTLADQSLIPLEQTDSPDHNIFDLTSTPTKSPRKPLIRLHIQSSVSRVLFGQEASAQPGQECTNTPESATKDSYKHKKEKKEKQDEHLGITESEQKLAYNCSACNKSFQRQWQLKRHSYQHTDAPRPFPCPDPLCTYSAVTKQHIDKHFKSIHERASSQPSMTTYAPVPAQEIASQNDAPKKQEANPSAQSRKRKQAAVSLAPLMAEARFEKDRACPQGCGLSFWNSKEYVAHSLACLKVIPTSISAREARPIIDQTDQYQQKPFSCEQCQITFTTPKQYVDHKIATHMKIVEKPKRQPKQQK